MKLTEEGCEDEIGGKKNAIARKNIPRAYSKSRVNACYEETFAQLSQNTDLHKTREKPREREGS